MTTHVRPYVAVVLGTLWQFVLKTLLNLYNCCALQLNMIVFNSISGTNGLVQRGSIKVRRYVNNCHFNLSWTKSV